MTANNRDPLVPQSPDHAGRHIAFVLHSMGGGGAQLSTLKLALGLIARGYKVDLFLLKAKGVFLAKVPASIRIFGLHPPIWTSLRHKFSPTNNDIPRSCQIHFVGSRWVSEWFCWFRLVTTLKWARQHFDLITPRLAMASLGIAAYLREQRPDVVLATLPHAKAGTILAKQLTKIPTRIIIILRNILQRRRKRQIEVARLLYQEAQAIIAISHGVAESIITETQSAPHRITTIYNPVITPQIEAMIQEKPDHPWMHQSEYPVILACGRLVPQKDFHTLLRAFAHLTHTYTHLIILGRGKEEGSLKALTCDLGLEERVSFPGWCDNPLAFMSSARLFVLSSRWEGLGNVLVEAMMCGCPVVSTDCPSGPREILEDGRWGELVPVGDDLALAQAIDRALEQQPDREGLQRRARYFSVDHAVDQYEKLF